MQVEHDHRLREIVVTTVLDLDARKGQEARMIGTARMQGARGPIRFDQARISGRIFTRLRAAL